MMHSDLLLIFSAYLATWILQIVSWPIIKKVFGKILPDMGWSLGRFATLLLVSLFVWEVSHLGPGINTNIGVLMTIGTLGIISLAVGLRSGVKGFLIPKDKLRIIFLEEYLFAVGFFGVTIVRGFLPNIDSLEKYMDYGFVVRYLNSPTLPATDMWQAGSSINYYSFGHFWTSVLIRIMGVVPQVGYNLALGFIGGLTLMFAFMVSKLLSEEGHERAEVLGGVVGALAVFLGGNGHTIWYAIKNLSLKGYWYADATRFIHNTIHEFPAYSFVVADLHGHLLDLPTSLLFLILFLTFVKNRSTFLEILLGMVMGIMMMTNTWNVPIFGLLLCVWGIGKIFDNYQDIGGLIKTAFVVLIVMALTALPWWIHFTPISSGIRLVELRSPLWQLGVLWSLSMITSGLGFFGNKDGEYRWANRAIIITAVLLLIIPELIYAKDIYPDHPRANTMFKLTYSAFIMFSVVLGGTVGKYVKQVIFKQNWRYKVGVVVSLAVFMSMLIYPTQSFPAFYENFNKYRGLDGELWIKHKSPEKYDVIQYLKAHKDGKNMVEAVGDSYTDLNAVSVFTGIPTIQGWRVHEWLWRGGYQVVALRESEVGEVYESKNLDITRNILKKYNVGWIYVGNEEQEKYKTDPEKLESLGKKVWEKDGGYLIQVPSW